MDIIKNDIPYSESDFSKEEKIVSILSGQPLKTRTSLTGTKDENEKIKSSGSDKTAVKNTNMTAKETDSGMTHDELENIVKGISGSTMQSLLCSIARHDIYNIISFIGSEEFEDIIYAVKTAMKNHGESTSVLKSADFELFDEIIHAIIIDYYMPLIKKYGNIDIKTNLKDIDQLIYFLSGAFDKYYNEIENIYNREGRNELHTFIVKSEFKSDKMIVNGVMWTLYTIDRKNFTDFVFPSGINNAVVRDKSKHILAFIDISPDDKNNAGYHLPDEFNMYHNSKSPEYQALALMLRILFRNDKAYCDSEEKGKNSYRPCYKSFIKSMINCFYDNNSQPERKIPHSLYNIIKRFLSGLETDGIPEFDSAALTVAGTLFDCISDEEFLSRLNDDDYLAEEILGILSDTIKDISLLPVYNSIIDNLVKHLAYLCEASTNTTKAIVSHTLKSVPVFADNEIRANTRFDSVSRLDRALEKIRREKRLSSE